MSRLPGLAQGSLTPQQQAVFENITAGKRTSLHGPSDMVDDNGALRGPFNAMLYNPLLGDAMQALGAAVRFETELADDLRELAILLVAARWQSQYEWYAHERIARNIGMSAALIDTLHAGARPDFERDEQVLVYDMTNELLDTRRLSAATYERAVGLLGYQGVVELVTTLGNYTLVSMLLNCFEVPVPDGVPPPFVVAGEHDASAGSADDSGR